VTNKSSKNNDSARSKSNKQKRVINNFDYIKFAILIAGHSNQQNKNYYMFEGKKKN